MKKQWKPESRPDRWPKSDRLIMHVDMDAFFASIELARHPELKGLPVCVGGPGPRRGVIAAASYKAREFGVHSAMPTFQAKELCPDIILIPPDFHEYSTTSRKIVGILSDITPEVEPCSIDESYLGLKGLQRIWSSPLEIAQTIKRRIREECNGITCSIGIGPSKTTAKVASDYEKPDGLTWVDNAKSFLCHVDLEDIPGIGRQTLKKLHATNIQSPSELQALSLSTLQELFGVSQGRHLYQIIRGEDAKTVKSKRDPQKSFSKSMTLDRNTTDSNYLLAILRHMCDQLSERLQRKHFFAKQVSIVIRYGNFQTILRHQALPRPMQSPRRIFPEVRQLFLKHIMPNRGVRMVGMGLGVLSNTSPETTLFNYKEDEKESTLLRQIKKIRTTHGSEYIRWGF